MVKVNPKKHTARSFLPGYVCLLLVLLGTIVAFLVFPSLQPVGNKIRKKSLSKLRLARGGGANKHLHTHATETNSDINKMSASSILQSGKAYLVYGTAWKKDTTARLVAEAIESGFRFIDTACQPKHYNEVGVGEGWQAASKKLNIKREDLYLQSKFTSLNGQDHNIPYDPNAEPEEQAQQSFQKSLENLQTTYLDAMILHSPMKTMDETIRVWRVFESFYDEGKARKLGISNIYSLPKLKELWNAARIKPSIVQNRFYADTNFDTDIRNFCKEQGIIYQSFWTLSASRKALKTKDIANLAENKNLSPQTLMYAFMMTLGHTPLCGTTDKAHMVEDMAVVKRIQSGEAILNDVELKFIADILGV